MLQAGGVKGLISISVFLTVYVFGCRTTDFLFVTKRELFCPGMPFTVDWALNIKTQPSKNQSLRSALPCSQPCCNICFLFSFGFGEVGGGGSLFH